MRSLASSSARALALALVTLASACAHFPRPIEEPTAKVRSCELGQAAVGIRGVVTLDVFNPNPIGLPLQRVDWQLLIGDGNAATGRVELGQTIPARGTAPVAASIYVGIADAASVAARVALGERRYQIRGVLRFSTSLGAVSVPFEVDGVLG